MAPKTMEISSIRMQKGEKSQYKEEISEHPLNATFSLTLTDSELEQRAHIAQPFKASCEAQLGQITYQPDEFDDLDEEDPDDDLDF
ncbi:hypothetical protein Ciccas_007421 [Cichlidogyrus casuarinus]|uniref:Elongator complex protein 5 n=1 Tax=Cichlidogyrus casuarinus TaxID=1844966 RepID=A0ABD2Q2Y3_9PLAT